MLESELLTHSRFCNIGIGSIKEGGPSYAKGGNLIFISELIVPKERLTRPTYGASIHWR